MRAFDELGESVMMTLEAGSPLLVFRLSSSGPEKGVDSGSSLVGDARPEVIATDCAGPGSLRSSLEDDL